MPSLGRQCVIASRISLEPNLQRQGNSHPGQGNGIGGGQGDAPEVRNGGIMRETGSSRDPTLFFVDSSPSIRFRRRPASTLVPASPQETHPRRLADQPALEFL